MAKCLPSFENDLQLCPIDQQQPGACRPHSCDNLHMCYDYLLNSKCSQFKLNGKCSHSHSLYTLHNKKILKKHDLSVEDDKTFEIISGLVQTSISKSKSLSKRPLRGALSSISNDDRDVDQMRSNSSEETGTSRIAPGRFRQPQHATKGAPSSVLIAKQSHETTANPLSKRSSSSNQPSPKSEKKISIARRFYQSIDATISRHLKKTDSSLTSTSEMTTRSKDLTDDQFDKQQYARKGEFTKQDRSSQIDDSDERSDSPPIAAAASQKYVSDMKVVVRDPRGNKETSASMLNARHSVGSGTRMKYVFSKQLKDDELCYLLGPGRRHLIETHKYQIFPSGYCRFENTNQGQQIDRILREQLPPRLKSEHVQFGNDDLALLICTSAAERFFEQNQMQYAIMSEPYQIQLSIEVIHAPSSDRSTSGRHMLSSRSSVEPGKSHMSPSDGKLRIASTNSSIDVISGDISKTPVDMMVCVSTSRTLLNSVLSQAGQSIISQFNENSRLKSIVLNGGHTSAKQILFISWELRVESSDKAKAQRSLSDFVKKCIDQAHHSQMTSISFPSIGTGEIGLDPNLVCESMIAAASECLNKYTMDVIFVIYPSSETHKKPQSYQIFRTYLDRLCQDTESKRVLGKRESISRDISSKRILTVSNLSDANNYHKLLVKSLEKLIVERNVNLSLIQSFYTGRTDLLIDSCLSYHVLPRIDFSKGELILRGDYDSCSQCSANLQIQTFIHQYSIIIEKGEKSEEIKMNMYVSLKIDEALCIGDSDIHIEDTVTTIFDIDLKKFRVRVSGVSQPASLTRKELNATSKIVPPSSWPSPLPITCTIQISRSSFNSLGCFHVFEETMSNAEWEIERIDAIENWPLYVHYTRKKSRDEILAFHGCPFSSVQSIIHYGLHSNNDNQNENPIRLTRDALNSHILGARRSTDKNYYIFVVELSTDITDQEFINLSNNDAHTALPTYLITYQRRKDS